MGNARKKKAREIAEVKRDYKRTGKFDTKAFEKAGGKMIDCQAYTENMARYGAVEIERNDFLARLKKLLKEPAISMPKF